jgi:YgiT-type zinc finger domain-containing protein
MVLKKCPLCGSEALRNVKGEFKAAAGKMNIVVPSVPRQKCTGCGEEFFGREANSVLDKYRGRHNRRIKAAA